MNEQVQRGRAPNGVTRVDRGTPEIGEQPHGHLEDGRALTQDGTWKHGKGGVSTAVQEWLARNGWNGPR